MNKGFSLLEMLVVVTIFAIIALVTSQAIILTLTGTHKADAISKVRQNVDFTMEAISRQLYNAKSISQCPNADTSKITFTDQNNNNVTFSCVNVNNSNQPSAVASTSGNLTGSDIVITSCSFVCNPAVGSAPPYVTITISAKQLTATGTSGITGGQNNAPVTSTTQVTLRSN